MSNYQAFPFNLVNNPTWRATLTKLQQVIMDRTHGTVKYSTYGDPTITATLNSVSEAVESAFVLVEKATLPKVECINKGAAGRTFSTGSAFFADGLTVTMNGGDSGYARKSASLWLAIAAHLEAEEKAAAAEAKKKADAVAAANRARATRLDGLAEEYFGEYLEDLGPKKTRVIEELYRLEQELANDQKDAA